MHCPACHAENTTEALTCSACGGPLQQDSGPSSAAPQGQSVRRSGSRRRAPVDEGEAVGRNQMAARAFRLSLWSLVPGLGLLLGPAALVLGCLVVRKVANDDMARGQARVAIAFGVLVTLAQWIGLALMIRGW
mgnify:CR=1 FL=1